MGFHENAIFPTGISYGSSGGPGFSTSVIVLDSGKEERVARWTTPKHRYNAAKGIRDLDDLVEVRDFYIARLGPAYGFRWKDEFDNTSSANGRDAPDDEDQTIGTGDGTETEYQLIKTYTDGGISRTRTISKPVSGTTIIALDGVGQGSGWSVNTTTGIVTFTSAPGAGVEVTAGYEFHVPARFGIEIDDLLNISYDAFDSGQIPDIPVVEIVNETAIADEYFYGGAYDHGNVAANFSITQAQGRVHTFLPTTSSLNVTLPALTNISPGGPHFYLFNQGAYDVTVKDNGGGTVITCVANGRVTLLVHIDAVSTKSWFAK